MENAARINLHLCNTIMKKLYGLATLMAVVLVGIAGFQLYWIRDNYMREQKAVEVRAQAIFRETVREVQDAVLQKKIKILLRDTDSLKDVKMSKFDGQLRLKTGERKASRVLHLLGEQRALDSGNKKTGLLIRVNNERPDGSDSTINETVDKVFVMRTDEIRKSESKPRVFQSRPPGIMLRERQPDDSLVDKVTEINTIYFNTKQGDNFKISVDSLYSDSASVQELTAAFSKKLDDQRLDIPFSIEKVPDENSNENDFIRRPLSFKSFEGYKLDLGNPAQFLIKKISMPILFSIVLVGLSVLSFVLLYRSLIRQHKLAVLKNDLISNITHELKTPIATVSVAIEALKNFNAIRDPEKTREYLDISQNELQRLQLLVDKVLKLSMFENNAIEIKKDMVDLRQVVNEVVDSLRLQLEKQQASIRVSAEGNLFVRGDRLHLLSVVYNLLDNALKYNHGKVDIGVNITEEAEQVVLNVVDNGIGIPPQYKNKIFEKFFRVPSGDTHNAKGHGLGLSYVSQVLRQHQGSIKVDSLEGQGSSFTLSLPKATG